MADIMNSSQRRKLVRMFPHVVNFVATSYQPYYIHDEKIADARKWCQKYLKGKHRVITGWDHAEFKFATEKDAVVFALKWL